MDKRIKVIQGGQSAGKNIAIAQILYKDSIQIPGLLSTIMADTYDNLWDGAIRDFKNIYDELGLDFDSHYNKKDKELKIGESTIQFRYISDTKSTAGKSKRRDRLYLNEANKFGWEVASTYIGRTHGDVYIDHNPDYEYWAHTEVPKLLDKEGRPISQQIIVTYKDNEMCPDSEIEYIEARKGNKKWYSIYGLGQTGTLSDRMIYNFDIAEIPGDAKRIPSGMDFAMSPDQTVLVDAYIKGANLYLDERFAMNNLQPVRLIGAAEPAVVDQMDIIEFNKGWQIIGDTSGKASILDMRKYGYNILGVKKRRFSTDTVDSAYQDISILRAYNIHITPRSLSLKKGMESWHWKIDRNGKIIPVPDGHEPDGLAAARYLMMYYKATKI